MRTNGHNQKYKKEKFGKSDSLKSGLQPQAFEYRKKIPQNPPKSKNTTNTIC